MNIFTLPGLRYLATRIGWRIAPKAAFNAKFLTGEWCYAPETGELPSIINQYLRQGSILMMGCGNAAIIKNLDYSLALGVDLSPVAIELARSNAADERAKFETADMEKWDGPGSFNVILFRESIYYLPPARMSAVFHRLSRRLKPGGVFIVTIFDPEHSRTKATTDLIRKHFAVEIFRPIDGSARHILVFR